MKKVILFSIVALLLFLFGCTSANNVNSTPHPTPSPTTVPKSTLSLSQLIKRCPWTLQGVQPLTSSFSSRIVSGIEFKESGLQNNEELMTDGQFCYYTKTQQTQPTNEYPFVKLQSKLYRASLSGKNPQVIAKNCSSSIFPFGKLVYFTGINGGLYEAASVGSTPAKLVFGKDDQYICSMKQVNEYWYLTIKALSLNDAAESMNRFSLVRVDRKFKNAKIVGKIASNYLDEYQGKLCYHQYIDGINDKIIAVDDQLHETVLATGVDQPYCIVDGKLYYQSWDGNREIAVFDVNIQKKINSYATSGRFAISPPFIIEYSFTESASSKINVIDTKNGQSYDFTMVDLPNLQTALSPEDFCVIGGRIYAYPKDAKVPYLLIENKNGTVSLQEFMAQ